MNNKKGQNNKKGEALRLSGDPSSPIKDNTIFSIGDLKNRFLNKRCFIMGNGPSLNKTNMKLLKDEYTIGANRIYLNYDSMGFEPTFYCCVNPYIIEQFHYEIDRLNSIKFIREESRRFLNKKKNLFLITSLPGFGFNSNFESLEWYEGWTVTYCAMQLAFYLGFNPVILIGVDHYFKVSGRPNQLVTAEDNDANHFHPDYFGKGIKWQYPDLKRSEISYMIANRVYKRYGRRILDATIDGKLQVFPNVEYQLLFEKDFGEKIVTIKDIQYSFIRRIQNSLSILVRIQQTNILLALQKICRNLRFS